MQISKVMYLPMIHDPTTGREVSWANLELGGGGIWGPLFKSPV